MYRIIIELSPVASIVIHLHSFQLLVFDLFWFTFEFTDITTGNRELADFFFFFFLRVSVSH